MAQKTKKSHHPIGATIENEKGERFFIFGVYWNGKVDVRDYTGKETVMSIPAQKLCRRLTEEEKRVKREINISVTTYEYPE